MHFSLAHLKQCQSLLKRSRLICGDFEKALKFASNGDFVYMDPPYATSVRRVFREYHDLAFTESHPLGSNDKWTNWIAEASLLLSVMPNAQKSILFAEIIKSKSFTFVET